MCVCMCVCFSGGGGGGRTETPAGKQKFCKKFGPKKTADSFAV